MKFKKLAELGISPAPWSIHQGCSTWIEDKFENYICDEIEWREEKTMPNARLIAAAPDLYDALLYCEQKLDALDPCCSVLRKARAALARASGSAASAPSDQLPATNYQLPTTSYQLPTTS